MLDLNHISAAIDSVAAEKEKVQKQLEGLLQSREELIAPALPKDDFIAMIIEEQSLRVNQLSERLFKKWERRIYQPMADLKIKGIQDSPLTWPIGTFEIPNDVWHCIFGKQINEAIVDAINGWDWPEEVGLTRTERNEKIAALDKEINELRSWLNQAKKLSSGQAA